MADAFYTDLRDNTVQPLLAKLGFPMQVLSSREPEIDPDTGAITVEATTVSTSVNGIFRFYSQDEISKQLQVGQDILANDIQALIEAKTLNAAGIDPDTAMQLIAKGETYNIVRVTPTTPGGVPVLYRLQIRK
jgi:hypothetical protein